jgi:hypothetical protein
MSNVAINILAEFVGKNAFDKAGKSINKLEKSAFKLGKSLGLALGTTAIVAFGRASVKAFASDEAAAQRLATAVDNLGLSFSKVKVADFVSSLETSAGIADDVLRPALQALLTTTGSLTKSQGLLNNAITISRATGIDLATVSQDLANGYVGITKGLKKYNTGLTQAELKSKSFSEVLGILLTRSAGAAESYLGTTAYKLSVLSVAADNAKESIGAGLVEAFAKMAGGTEASDAAKAINNIAKAINSITGAVGSAIGGVTKLYGKLNNFVQNFDPILGGSIASENLTKSARSKSPAGTARRTAQQRLAEAAAVKRAKELAALQAKQVKAQKELTAEQKKQALLKKAGTLFDVEQANLIAALKGNLSDADRKRAELQLALLTGNIKEVQKLTYEIGIAQGLSKELAGYLATLPDAKNPFAAWEKYLDMIAKKAAEIPKVVSSVSANAIADTTKTVTEKIASDPLADYRQKLVRDDIFGATPTTSLPASNVAPTAFSGYGTNFRRAEEQSNLTGPIQVVVQIDGKEIASSNQSQSLSGNPSSVSRLAGMFAG